MNNIYLFKNFFLPVFLYFSLLSVHWVSYKIEIWNSFNTKAHFLKIAFMFFLLYIVLVYQYAAFWAHCLEILNSTPLREKEKRHFFLIFKNITLMDLLVVKGKATPPPG